MYVHVTSMQVYNMRVYVLYIYTAARIWNSPLRHVTSTPSLTVFQSRLKTSLHSLFPVTSLYITSLYSARAVTVRHLGHFNRNFLLT